MEVFGEKSNYFGEVNACEIISWYWYEKKSSFQFSLRWVYFKEDAQLWMIELGAKMRDRERVSGILGKWPGGTAMLPSIH